MIVTFDLENPGRNYQPLINKIMEIDGEAIRLGGSAFLLHSPKNPADVRNDFVSLLSSADRLYVGDVATRAAWFGMTEGTNKSIRDSYSKHFLEQLPPSPAPTSATVTTAQPPMPEKQVIA